MSGKYILDGKTPVLCDLLTWARWFENSDRRVASTEVGGVHISTVFLGLDHSFGHGPPLLFETMVFRDGDGEEQERYSTWEEAEAGHERMVERVRNPDR